MTATEDDMPEMVDMSDDNDSADNPGSEGMMVDMGADPGEMDPGMGEPTEMVLGEDEAMCTFFDQVMMVERSEYPTGQLDGLSDEDCEATEEWIEEARNRSLDLDVAPLAGTWRGGSGDGSVELVVDATGHGTIRYGEATELPPIEDPSASYLTEQMDSVNVLGNIGPRLGFTYTLHPENGRASEMSARLRLGEPWAEWCELQEPQRGRNCYACDIFAGSGATFMSPESECNDTEETLCYATHTYDSGAAVATPMDCGRYQLCGALQSVCACTSENCTENPDNAVERTFSLDPVDTSVIRVPNLWGAETVYLTRVAE